MANSKQVWAAGAAFLGLGAAWLAGRRRWREPAAEHELSAEVVIDLPVDRVFVAWSNLERFPTYCPRVEDVVVYGDGRMSCWVVRGPGGWPMDFDAAITRMEPGRLLAWRTLSGAAVAHRGHVAFRPEGEATRVVVRAWWTPPGGVLGAAIAGATDAAERVLQAELAHLKAALEPAPADPALDATRS